VSQPAALKTLISLNIQKQLILMYIDNKQNNIHSAAFSVDVGYQIASKSIQWFRRRRSSADKWKKAIIPFGVLCTTYKERMYIGTVTSAHRSANLESYAFLRSVITKHEIL